MAATSDIYAVEHFGEEREPIVIIDDFSGIIDTLENMGRAARYNKVQGYPGERSLISPRYFSARFPMIVDIFAKHFDGSGARTESCAFSVVTTPESELLPSQCIPHFDDSSSGLMALLHFTGSAESGGTTFYRHKRSGFEAITPSRVPDYNAAVAEDDREFGAPAQTYFYGTSDRYEMIGEVSAKSDRAIIYRGRLLHSGHIPNPPAHGVRPEKARLTINTFLHASP